MGLIERVIRERIRKPLKRAARRQARRVSAECPVCRKRYVNPLTHKCTVRTDFRKRKRAAGRQAARERQRQRKREAAARRRERAKARRKEAAERRKAAAAERRRKAREKRSAPRPARPAHDFRACDDDDCRRYACVGYKAGYADAEADLERENA